MNGNWRLKAIAPMCRLYYQNGELDGMNNDDYQECRCFCRMWGCYRTFYRYPNGTSRMWICKVCGWEIGDDLDGHACDGARYAAALVRQEGVGTSAGHG